MCIKENPHNSLTESIVDNNYLLELLQNHLVYVQSLQNNILIPYSNVEQNYLRDKVASLRKKIDYLKEKTRTAQIVTAS